MELQELLEISPASYLREGFLTEEGTSREGINGRYSLAIAYQCRAEGVDLEELKNAVEQLKKTEPDSKSVKKTIASLNSPALQRLLQASEPWLKDLAQYKAFVAHLERILHQTAIITMMPTEEDPLNS
jgi:hypothetical protein